MHELSSAARAELDRMLETSLRMAKGHLDRASEFDPFSLVTDRDGRLLAVDLDKSGLGKHPDSELIAAALVGQLRHIADTLRCTALTVNSRLSEEKTDALEVRLEHREGAAVLVLLPYKRPTFGGIIEYGELRVFPSPVEIWTVS